MGKYIWKENETFQAKIFFHNFSDDDFLGKNVEVCLIDSNKRKKLIYKKVFKINSAERGNEFLGEFNFKFCDIKQPENLKLCLKFKTNKKIIYFPTDFQNQETIPGTYCTDFLCYPMFRSISEIANEPEVHAFFKVLVNLV